MDTGTSRVKLTEIFLSIQGEGTSAGWPSAFVRLTGCPLRCRYCDTEYAFYGGEWTTLDAVLARVAALRVRHVCVTGGEPLAQRGCLPLLAGLCDARYEVSLETSGALSVAAVDPRVIKVLDVKTPASGESARNRLENLELLGARDQIKFVICDRTDFEWSRDFVHEHGLAERSTVLFSPAWSELAPGTLADWILADGVPVRLQLQLHKILWGDVRGR
jgi:7-carboxy-7-deazaguanine synthase